MLNPAKRRRSRRHTGEQTASTGPAGSAAAARADSPLLEVPGSKPPAAKERVLSASPVAGDSASQDAPSDAEPEEPALSDADEGSLAIPSEVSRPPSSQDYLKRDPGPNAPSLGMVETPSGEQKPLQDSGYVPYKPVKAIDDNNRIWKDYFKEATEEDRDMLESWNNDLDTLLVFSGLFSAILTAFLLESYQDLKPDSSTAVVAAIQEGFRTFSNVSDSATPSEEVFKADDRSIRVNTVWFTSLALSITSAAAAMLAKSWLVAYSRQLSLGSMVQRAEKRQKRYEGLKRWKFQNTMDFLPFPLFVSLILFGVGLCDFLFGLNHIMAIISTSIFSVALAALVVANVLRIFIPECPYHIPIPISIKLPNAKTTLAIWQDASNKYGGMKNCFQSLTVGFHNLMDYPQEPWGPLREISRSTKDFLLLPLFYVLSNLTRAFHAVIDIVEKRKLASAQNYRWKTEALAWIIQTSTSEIALKNALRLIPATGTALAGFGGVGSLCKKEVVDRVAEYFFATKFGGVNSHAGASQLTTDSRSVEDTQAFGHSLRVLLGELQHSRLLSEGLYVDPIDSDYISGRLSSQDFQDPCLRLLKSSMMLYFPDSMQNEWSPDVPWAAEQGSPLEDWLRLFLIQDLGMIGACLMGSNRVTALDMVCGIMRPVEITQESVITFLHALRSILSPELVLRVISMHSILHCHDSMDEFTSSILSLLETCMDSIPSIHRNPTSHDYMDSNPTAEQSTRQSLETASLLLLNIFLYLLRDSPERQKYSEPRIGFQNFVRWAITIPSLSREPRNPLPALIAECPRDYIEGMDKEVLQLCLTVITRFGSDPEEDQATQPALALALEVLENIGQDGAQLVLDLLENDPSLAATIVSMLDRSPDIDALLGTGWLWAACSDLMRDYGSSPTEAVYNTIPSNTLPIVEKVLLKLVESDLLNLLLSKLAQSKKDSTVVSHVIHGIASLPSLTRHAIMNEKLVAQLVSSMNLSSQGAWRHSCDMLTVFLLARRVREVCNEEERAAWLKRLVDLGFLHSLAGQLRRTDSEYLRSWSTHCFYPFIQDLEPHKSELAASRIVTVMEECLLPSRTYDPSP